MLANRIGRRTAARNGVVAGSVWENRMRIDQGKGGVKVFNGGENPEEEGDQDAGFQVNQRLKSNQTDVVVRNRKTWKSEIEGDPIQLRKSRSDLLVKLGEDLNEEKILSNVGQVRSRRRALSNENGVENEEEDEEEEMEIEKEIDRIDIKEMDSTEEKQRTIEEKEKIDEETISLFKQRSAVEKGTLQQNQEKHRKIHEIPTSPFKHRNVAEKEKVHQIHENPVSPFKRRTVEEKEKLHQIQEMPISPFKQRNVVEKNKVHQIHEIPEYVEKQRSLAEKQKIYQFHEIPNSANMEKKSPQPQPIIDHSSVDPDLTTPPPIAVGQATLGEIFDSIQETQNRLQSIVDLVMWRDISKSAFVFGLGTFILLSSSFTKDLNFSLVSAISYLGLFYLAAIFFYKSILCRGTIYLDDRRQKYMVGEEEAIWALKLILPYFNELLINIRSLFSGDPATTMKLAILLFVLARCGSSITIWTMTRLGFFGIFTLPKFCSVYSYQINEYGKFWVRRFRDAWNSCTHKKVVAAAMFTVIWNSSSITARIWAVFMLIAAVRFYQQSSSLVKEE